MIHKERVTPKQLQITLAGSIYTEEAYSIRKSLIGHIDRGNKSISIDMTDVDFIDGAGLKTFEAINKRAMEKGVNIVIKGLQGIAQAMFDLTQVNKSFDGINNKLK